MPIHFVSHSILPWHQDREFTGMSSIAIQFMVIEIYNVRYTSKSGANTTQTTKSVHTLAWSGKRVKQIRRIKSSELHVCSPTTNKTKHCSNKVLNTIDRLACRACRCLWLPAAHARQPLTRRWPQMDSLMRFRWRHSLCPGCRWFELPVGLLRSAHILRPVSIQFSRAQQMRESHKWETYEWRFFRVAGRCARTPYGFLLHRWLGPVL